VYLPFISRVFSYNITENENTIVAFDTCCRFKKKYRNDCHVAICYIFLGDRAASDKKCIVPLSHWDSGIESHSRRECLLYSIFVMSCVDRDIATGWSAVCKIIISELILNGNRPESLIRQGRRRSIYFLILVIKSRRFKRPLPLLIGSLMLIPTMILYVLRLLDD
jgi:hypothetical protein